MSFQNFLCIFKSRFAGLSNNTQCLSFHLRNSTGKRSLRKEQDLSDPIRLHSYFTVIFMLFVTVFAL